jgi:hypothetical protein
VGNRPISEWDPLGLDVIVIIGGAVSDNPGGHAAIAVTGKGCFSFGTTHSDGTPLNDYLLDQSKVRDQWLYRIPTTSEEDQKIIDAFNRVRDAGYSIKEDRSCSSAASQGLKDIGVLKRTTPFPKMLKNWLDMRQRRERQQQMFLPRGSTTIPVTPGF